jgi:hypothetical protein
MYSEKVVIWCSEWGNLEADGANEAVVAKTFEEGVAFWTIDERSHITELIQALNSANKEDSGGDKTSFDKFWLATLQLGRYWSFAQNMLNTCQQFHESCRYNRKVVAVHTPETDLYWVTRDGSQTH